MFVDADRSDRLAIKSWTLPELKALYTKWQDMQSKQGGWTANYLSNHDQVCAYTLDMVRYMV